MSVITKILDRGSSKSSEQPEALPLEVRFLLESPDAFKMLVGNDLFVQLPRERGVSIVDSFGRAEAELARLRRQMLSRATDSGVWVDSIVGSTYTFAFDSVQLLVVSMGTYIGIVSGTIALVLFEETNKSYFHAFLACSYIIFGIPLSTLLRKILIPSSHAYKGRILSKEDNKVLSMDQIEKLLLLGKLMAFSTFGAAHFTEALMGERIFSDHFGIEALITMAPLIISALAYLGTSLYFRINNAITHDEFFPKREDRVTLKKVIDLGKSARADFSQAIRENPELGLIYFKDYLPSQIEKKQASLTQEISVIRGLISEWETKENAEDREAMIQLLKAKISGIEHTKARLKEQLDALKPYVEEIKKNIEALKAQKDMTDLRRKTKEVLSSGSLENSPEELFGQALEKALDGASETNREIRDILDQKTAADEVEQIARKPQISEINEGINNDAARRRAQVEVAQLAKKGSTTGSALLLGLGILTNSGEETQTPPTFPTIESPTSIAHAQSHQTDSHQIRNRVTKLNSARLEAARLRSRQSVMRFV